MTNKQKIKMYRDGIKSLTKMKTNHLKKIEELTKKTPEILALEEEVIILRDGINNLERGIYECLMSRKM